MNNMKSGNTCFFNTLYIQYIEDIGQNSFFNYDLKYPIIYNVKNGYFQVNELILKNLNQSIKSSVYAFKDGILEEENQVSKDDDDIEVDYTVYSNYDVTFNKNQAISLILDLYSSDDDKSEYNDIYSYNVDLLSGNQILIKDIFRPGIDYLKLVADFVNFKISQNPKSYYPNINIAIPDDQSFYLTDKGIVIYFGVDEISNSSNGIPKFLMEFSEFESYINSRFYCSPKNNQTAPSPRTNFRRHFR